MPVVPEKLPEKLKTGKQYVGWNWEWDDKRQSWTKPLRQLNGRYAKSNDPSTWAFFEEVLAAHQSGQFDGVGRCFTMEDEFCAFDLDNCRDGEGNPKPWAESIMTDLDSYTEITPSGAGYRVWATGQKPGPRSGKDDIEIYDRTSKRYLCLTGNVLNGNGKIEPRQAAIDAIYNRIFTEPDPAPQRQPQTEPELFQWDGDVNHLPVSNNTKNLILNGCGGTGQRSEPMMTVLNALAWSNLTDAQIYEIFESYPVGEKYREKGDGRHKWLQPQIDKARARTSDRAKASWQSQEGGGGRRCGSDFFF